MTALGYVRRSKESGERTVSLEDQGGRIADYCRAQGWQLAEILADDGVSGGRRERLERMTERVRVTGARFIVVYHLDRFARDLAGTLDYVRRFARRGVELHVVGRGRVEADTASGFIVTAVEGLAAEHYRRLISEKTRDALARLRTQHRRVSGRLPYGYQLGPDGLHLEAHAGEQVVLGLVATFAAGGLSLRRISARLAAAGILARSGRPFTASTLAPMVRLVRDRAVTDSAGASARGSSTASQPPRSCAGGWEERDRA